MNAQQGLPNLTFKQKLIGTLGLIGFGVIAFAAAGFIFTLLAALLIISSIGLAIRWVWCKITGKPFLPGVDIYRQQMDQMRQPFGSQRAKTQSKPSQTLEGEFRQIDNDQ